MNELYDKIQKVFGLTCGCEYSKKINCPVEELKILRHKYLMYAYEDIKAMSLEELNKILEKHYENLHNCSRNYF